MNRLIPGVEDFRSLERTRLDALVHKNMALARQLHAPDFQLITPTGASYTREEYLGKVASGELNYVKWEPGEISVRLFPGVALLRYRADLLMGAAPQSANSFSCWHTDSYEQRGDAWQVVLSQATLVRG
jgi:hypothetical protein